MGSGVPPVMKRQADAGPHMGWPYWAVGMQSALESAIGLPSRSTSASRMLAFLTPADVRRSFTMPPDPSAMDCCGLQTGVRRADTSLLNGAI
jgi:hypothetical protein